MYASLLNCDILDKKTLEDQDVPQPNFYYWLATDVPTDFWNNFLSSCNMIVWIKLKFILKASWMRVNQSIYQSIYLFGICDAIL